MIKLDSLDTKIIDLTANKTISGEHLSNLFNISRTAIWKRIKKLENLGYKFLHSKEGYRLLKRTHFLLENEIKHLLKTEFIGKNYIFFEEIDSTNVYSKNFQLKDGTVVFAETQTRGKGRKGRKWVSVKGKGLYFSITLRPKISVNELLKFSLIFPLAINKTVQEYGVNSKIKWPNDVYINNKKISGILLETNIEGNEVNRVIAGIGINVNHSIQDLNGIEDIATSLKIEKKEPVDRKKFFIDILKNIEIYYFSFLNQKLNTAKEVEKNLLWIGERVVLIDGNQKIEGVLTGINEYGGLKVLINGRKILDFYSGDLTLRHI